MSSHAGGSTKEGEPYPLSSAEVAILLHKITSKTRRKPKEHIEKTLDYCKKFCGIPDVLKKEKHVIDMREALESESTEVDGREEKLTPEEVVKIMNLRPQDADSASDAISSLSRFKQATLEKMLRSLDEK